MRIRILGCSGGIGIGLRTTSILIDDDILIDTGTGIGDLSLYALRRIRHVFMTHSHMDHSSGLPLMMDTVFDALDEPVQIHGRVETLEAIKAHIFNWVIWPDFAVIPTVKQPSMTYREMAPGSVREVGWRRIRMVDVNHTVPCAGYVIEANDRVFAFSGDTTTNDNFWEVLNEYPRVDLLVVETAFANRNAELAALAKHYCPKTLAEDLKKLRHDPDIYITHFKPGSEDEIFNELLEAVPDRNLYRLRGGESFEL